MARQYTAPITEDFNIDFFNQNSADNINELDARVEDLEDILSSTSLILTSPDGTRFRITVNNSGTLGTAEIT